MKCKNCGEEIANDSKFCQFCGAKQSQNVRRKWWLYCLVGLLATLAGVVLLLMTRPSIGLNHKQESIIMDTVKVETNNSTPEPILIDTVRSEADNTTQEQSVSSSANNPNPSPRTYSKHTNTGCIEIASVPSGASIWLDEKDTKKTTPDVLTNIAIGEHRIKIILEGYEEYNGIIDVTAKDQDPFFQLLVQKKDENMYIGIENGHEWVDLGVSVKWATCNIGAASPSGYGYYYAFGETATKNDYSWSTLLYCSDATGDSFTKYNSNPQYGEVDNKTRLDLTDDAARANWGGKWRMPTEKEFSEMLSGCYWHWTTQDGKAGYKFTSAKNGCSIFIPAAGFKSDASGKDIGTTGYYWTSSTHDGRPYYGYNCNFNSAGVFTGDIFRYYGLTIRPVLK